MAEDFDGTVPQHSPEAIPIVGLGASAGGVRALKDFFAAVAPGRGIAYIVVLHLSPEHESRLAEVLQTTTRIPVRQISGGITIEPDHVYVVPPNKSFEVIGGSLLVSDVTRVEQRRAPVDVFFRALADAYGSHAVCVVLSGTGPNGSIGLKRVKEHGGLTIAQDPAEAEYGDMPRNSIATGLVDLILPVLDMPGRIAEYFDRLRRDGDEAPVVARGGSDADALRDILAVLRVRTGHDFSGYKPATLQRRVERRANVQGLPTLASYAMVMRQQPDEASALIKELLISVTNFFRDPAAWLTLEQRIIPRLFANKSNHDQVRVWVPGCATGEEAYSVAMLLVETANRSIGGPSTQVFATDLDAGAVAAAREGFYTEAEVADVPEERLERFFVRETGGWRVRRELREVVLFAHHNVIKDPPFSHIDLIACRNLLIYLNHGVQERVIERFHFALRPGGYLFLGTSESPDAANDLFVRSDSQAHIYERRPVMSRMALTLTETPALTPIRPLPELGARPMDRISLVDLHQRLLEQYAPPSLIVTEEHNIVHMSETVGRYLRMPGGEPSRDLLRLIDPALRGDLRTALHQAAKERTTIDVRVPVDDGQRVTISVKPVLREGDPARGYFLVTFTDSDGSAPDSTAVTLSSPEPIAQQLEEELAHVKSQLRSTVEQYETQAEEAKAANEELQAMNEELRSAAEELETSREELQSVNEELSTVNQELKIKIEELGYTNNDFQNYINATDIGTIFLDRSLRVKFSTPRAKEVFNLLASDIGRPLSDITCRLVYESIHEDARSVLDTLQGIEAEAPSDDGRWYLMRLIPYRTTDNRIDGVVITFQDTTERRHAEALVRENEERLRLLIESAVDYAVFTLTDDGRIESWNPGAERMFGYSSDEIVDADIGVLYTPEDRDAGIHLKEIEQARRVGRAAEERYLVRKNGERLYCSGVMTPLGTPGSGFARIARDLTAQRQAADALADAHTALETRVIRRTTELEAEVRQHSVAKLEVTALLHRLVGAQEDERARIARDLHDHLGQQLTALRLALERHQSRLDGGASVNIEDLDHALSLTKKIGHDLDFLGMELRPRTLDELGLAVALPRFVAEWSAHVGIPAEFRASGVGHLRPQAELAFYRVTQEALNNVAKHAHASRVDVILASNDGQVVLVIEDDGVGFDPKEQKAKGFGLAGMRERAALVGASLEVDSTPGRGTSIFLRAPVSRRGGKNRVTPR